MTNFLDWINANVKKGAAAAAIMTVVAYCAAKSYLWAEEVTLIWGLVTIIFGAASYQWQITALKASQSSQI